MNTDYVVKTCKTFRKCLEAIIVVDGGTGSVLVQVEDENDVAPSFSSPDWRVNVPESAAPNTTVALLTVLDPDTSNNLVFRIVPNSGPGWDLFYLTHTDGSSSGALAPITYLDFEDSSQREGFNFKVEVTDEGPSWEGRRASSSVSVRLLDSNDHSPHLHTEHLALSITEDLPVGTLLAFVNATDGDQGLNGKLNYKIVSDSNNGQYFEVSASGRLTLKKQLDREMADHHELLVLVSDHGTPALTATATVTVTVADVNDNPPILVQPAEMWLWENSEAKDLGGITLDDADDWKLDHGPPFDVALDPEAPPYILNSFQLKQLPISKADGGRSSAVLSSTGPLDREAHGPLLLVPIIVTDVGGVAQTATVTVHLGDRNDNPTKAGHKIVHTEHQLTPLGRVYVNDPDDWDVGDKEWRWAGTTSHPMFILQSHTGQLAMQGAAQDGTLLERLAQSIGEATGVVVKIIAVQAQPLAQSYSPSFLSLTHSSFSPASSSFYSPSSSSLNPIFYSTKALPAQTFTNVSGGWKNQNQPEFMGAMSRSESFSFRPKKTARSAASQKLSLEYSNDSPVIGTNTKSHSSIENWKSLVWVSGSTEEDFDLLLLRYAAKMSSRSGVRVAAVGVGICGEVVSTAAPSPVIHPYYDEQESEEKKNIPEDQKRDEGPGKIGRDQLMDASWVVDANQTALVTPRILPSRKCGMSGGRRGRGIFPSPASTSPGLCRPNPCRNGGRCVLTHRGFKCVCPAGADPPFCKILSRFFPANGGSKGWLWLTSSGSICNPNKIMNPNPKLENSRRKSRENAGQRPGQRSNKKLPLDTNILCPGHLSLEFRSRKRDCLLFYAGPMGDRLSRVGQTMDNGGVLSAELQSGRLRVLFAPVGQKPIILTVKSDVLVDLRWHRLDISWNELGVELLIDLCRRHDKAPCHSAFYFQELVANDAVLQTKNQFPSSATFLRNVSEDHEGRRNASSGGQDRDASHDSRTDFSDRNPDLPSLGFLGELEKNNILTSPPFPPSPLQIGGLAQSIIGTQLGSYVTEEHFEGCIRNVRINGELADLGGGRGVSEHSSPGCLPSDPCTLQGAACPAHSKCLSTEEETPVCGCDVGHVGEGCKETAAPVSLLQHSYVKLALSVTPPAHYTDLKLRFRSLSSFGELVSLTSQHRRDGIRLHLHDSRLCLSLALGVGAPASYLSELCLTQAILNDGQWHTVIANRIGRFTELIVDEGDYGLYNNSFSTTFAGQTLAGHPRKLDNSDLEDGGEKRQRKLALFSEQSDDIKVANLMLGDVYKNLSSRHKDATKRSLENTPSLNRVFSTSSISFTAQVVRKSPLSKKRLHFLPEVSDKINRRNSHSDQTIKKSLDEKSFSSEQVLQSQLLASGMTKSRSSIVYSENGAAILQSTPEKEQKPSSTKLFQIPKSSVSPPLSFGHPQMGWEQRPLHEVKIPRWRSRDWDHTSDQTSRLRRSKRNKNKKVRSEYGKRDKVGEEKERFLFGWTGDIEVDRQEGFLIGGIPAFDGVNTFTVTSDLHTGHGVRERSQVLPGGAMLKLLLRGSNDMQRPLAAAGMHVPTRVVDHGSKVRPCGRVCVAAVLEQWQLPRPGGGLPLLLRPSIYWSVNFPLMLVS
ncbi:Cadherin [Trinorchestia longiramus]|nr:Cadherin [Trinorchestia longiramus]